MLTIQNLIDDIAAGCKPESAWRLGVEHEQFAFNAKTGAALPYETPYDGAPGIRTLLETLAHDYGFSVKSEDGNPVALEKNGFTVTLEPGGQAEFSGSPCATLADMRTEMGGFYAQLETVCAKHGIGLLRAGFHPRWRREDIHWMPKGRYAIMRDYMKTRGRLGIDMMLRTCGAQINLDFSDEADMVRKYRVALALQPVVIALMANSRMVESRDSGYASYRAHVWTDTDPDRCGVPAFVFSAGMGFARYADYALDVPMYFIRRDGKYINIAGQSFRDFLEGRLKGHEGLYPTLDDWRDHLTTLYPAIRLKRYLELRGPDSGAPEMVYAMAAFWTGILYDKATLDAAHDLTKDWPVEEHLRLHEAVPRDGLDTLFPGKGFRAFAADMLDLAAQGLARRKDDKNAAALLAPFWQILRQEDALSTSMLAQRPL